MEDIRPCRESGDQGRLRKGMEKRKQFTFYRSYYEAVEELPQGQRERLLLGIIRYALDGVEPEELTGMEKAMMVLIKPTLDSGRKQALYGKKGGTMAHSRVRQGSVKGSASESEKEIEKENENEIENEVEKEGFCQFWEAYPCKLDKDKALLAWMELGPGEGLVLDIMNGLARWKDSPQWLENGGRFVPRAAKWLRGRYFECPPGESGVPKGASGVLGEAELEAIRRVMEMES